MDIESVGINTSLRLYYKANNLQSGQDVVFNIWDSDGTALHVNTPADGEIGSRGIYYLDITTPNSEVYLLVKGSLSSGSNPGVSIYSVGQPLQKLFYVHGSFSTGQVLPYRIFDINADEESSGDLTEVAGGFYYADASTITNNLDLFFRVGDIAYQFELTDSSVVIVGGGVLASGAATFTFIFNNVVGGGVLGGGISDTEKIDGIGGGVLAGGSADEYRTFPEAGSGGALVGGTADVQFIYNPTLAGGSLVSGEAGVTLNDVIETTGGVVVGGTSDESLVQNEVADGGALCSGLATVDVIYNISVSGGALAGGDATESIGGEVGGGALVGGTAVATVIYNLQTAGGCLVGGLAEDLKSSYETGSGGCLVSGSADTLFTYTPVIAGGCVAGGSATEYCLYYVISTGGVLAGGTSEEDFNDIIIGSGGSSVGGTALANVIYNIEFVGGSLVGGDAVESSIQGVLATGGATVSGQSVQTAIYNQGTQGGVLCSGEAIALSDDVIPVSGGAVVGGTGSLLVSLANIDSIGGAVVGGEAFVEDVQNDTFFYEGSGEIRIGGKAEYVSLGRMWFVKFFPGEEYTGFKIISVHHSTRRKHQNFYDLSTGERVPEYLIYTDSEFKEKQLKEIAEYYDVTLDKLAVLESTAAIPAAGDTISVPLFNGNFISIGILADIKIALKKIQETTPDPSPVGGTVQFDAYTSRSVNLPLDTLQIRLAAIQNTTPDTAIVGGKVLIDGPSYSGASIGALEDIQRRLKALQEETPEPSPVGKKIQV